MGAGYYGGSFNQYKESPPKKTPIWQTIVTAWFIASVVMGLGFLFYKLIFWR